MARRKWELLQENVHGTKTVMHVMWGMETTNKCVYDVYRRLRRNGTYKYKNVEH